MRLVRSRVAATKIKEVISVSAILDNMERTVDSGYIDDPEQIEKIIGDFLNMKCYELSPYEPSFYEKDIAQGFDLEVGRLRDRAMKDILAIIGYMPSNSWFQSANEEPWFRQNRLEKDFCCAISCYYLLFALLNDKHNIDVRMFMHIQYKAFCKYINLVSSIHQKGSSGKILEIVTYINGYIRENKPDADLNSMTLGNVLEIARKNGGVVWTCGIGQLSQYVGKLVSAYKVIKLVFMDCIRQNLISADRDCFMKLLDSCSPTGEYENFGKLEFDSCYEM